jgi:hypothetical protein
MTKPDKGPLLANSVGSEQVSLSENSLAFARDSGIKRPTSFSEHMTLKIDAPFDRGALSSFK